MVPSFQKAHPPLNQDEIGTPSTSYPRLYRSIPRSARPSPGARPRLLAPTKAQAPSILSRKASVASSHATPILRSCHPKHASFPPLPPHVSRETRPPLRSPPFPSVPSARAEPPMNPPAGRTRHPCLDPITPVARSPRPKSNDMASESNAYGKHTPAGTPMD